MLLIQQFKDTGVLTEDVIKVKLSICGKTWSTGSTFRITTASWKLK